MSYDFQTSITLTERDIEIIGNVLVQHFLKNPPEPGVCSPESALLQKILNTREAQITEAWAAGRFK